MWLSATVFLTLNYIGAPRIKVAYSSLLAATQTMNKTSGLELEWNTIVDHEPEIRMLREVTLDADTNRKWLIYIFKYGWPNRDCTPLRPRAAHAILARDKIINSLRSRLYGCLLRENNLVFFTAGCLACFEPTKAAKVLKKVQVHSVLYGQGKHVFKRECLYF